MTDGSLQNLFIYINLFVNCVVFIDCKRLTNGTFLNTRKKVNEAKEKIESHLRKTRGARI